MIKKITIAIFLICAHQTFTLPVENPSSPLFIKDGLTIPATSWVNCRIGYEGDFVSDGKMKQVKESAGRVDAFKIINNSAKITINFLDRIDTFCTLGAAKIKANWRCHPAPINFFRITTQTDYRFAWSIGAQAAFFEWGKATLSFGGRYFYTKPQVKQIAMNGDNIDITPSYFTEKAWQIDAGISYKIGFLIPYISATYLNNSAHIVIDPPLMIADNYSNTLHMKNRKNWGVTIGCGITNAKFFAFNIEARLVDEEAATILGEFRF
jgi:hypothetical protein